MKIVSALGGGGSTFIVTQLRKANFRYLLPKSLLYKLYGRLLSVKPNYVGMYLNGLQRLGAYRPLFEVLRRPGAFWTDFRYHELAAYDPGHPDFGLHLRRQKEYILSFLVGRSAGLPLNEERIAADSLDSLVKSYLDEVSEIERCSEFTAVLVSTHWGEFGAFKNLGVDAIYVIRDPFNALISHSKPGRHQKDYLKRGLTEINSKEWIDTYLHGPAHCWIQHSKVALSHPGATIVRYQRFPEDWQQVRGLPDIGKHFVYQQNDITRTLTADSIEYIYEQVKDICRDLKIRLPI